MAQAQTLPDALADLDPGRFPRHVAVIMDGNGRWARQRGWRRVRGHERGVTSVRCTVEEGARLGLEQLTLYCLSIENWKRPKFELNFLMKLLSRYVIEERETIMNNNIRFTTIGHREGLPAKTLKQVDETVQMSRDNTGMVLCLAINYGGRTEIADAARRIAVEAAAGRLAPEQVDEQTVEQHLYTAGMSDPDLLIRTAGEMRISNFLLWQISYAELWVTEAFWPEFRESHLHQAIRDYASRDRRFGGLNPSATS